MEIISISHAPLAPDVWILSHGSVSAARNVGQNSVKPVKAMNEYSLNKKNRAVAYFKFPLLPSSLVNSKFGNTDES